LFRKVYLPNNLCCPIAVKDPSKLSVPRIRLTDITEQIASKITKVNSKKVEGIINDKDIDEILLKYGLSDMPVRTRKEVENFISALAKAIGKEIGEVDIVCGIPYYQEYDNVSYVLKTQMAGYDKFFPDKRCLFIAVGTKSAGEAGNKAFEDLKKEVKKDKGKHNIVILHLDEMERGKGRAV